MHVIAGKAVCLGEALKDDFKEYQKQIVKNASVLADALLGKGFNLVSGGTDNHLMLVDLARNDLGRVCESGSVEVTRYMDCEYFSHVMHLVSDVQGKVKAGMKQIQVLRSAFPAGTVSGSPKISAIEILSRLEKIKRRFYAGAIGYLQASGDLDFCIGIRCALKQESTWTLQAGGGIVYDSNPDREWEETNEKLGALRAVLDNTKK